MTQTPASHAARTFFAALAVTAPIFAVVKLTGLDERPWSVVLSAAVVTAALVATWRLVASSIRATSR